MKSMEKMLDLAKKLQVESSNYPHGIICSGKTARLLKDKFESISEDGIKSIIYGIPVCVEEYFTEENVWILNKECWEIYRREGLVGLIKYMAIKKGVSEFVK